MVPVADSPLCLVIEDQVLIGMAVQASLENAGFRVAGPFMRNADALEWLDKHTPDLALVDILLKDGPCTRVVRALQRQGIPFAIYSGLKPGDRPHHLGMVRWIEKQASRQDLAGALRGILSRSERGRIERHESGELVPQL